MSDDRTVHATLPSGDLIVRLNRAGKWYRESEGRRFQIGFLDAVALASKPGSVPHLDRPGGKRFDEAVRKGHTAGPLEQAARRSRDRAGVASPEDLGVEEVVGMAADRRDAEVEAVAREFYICIQHPQPHEPTTHDRRMAERVIAALDAVRARSPQDEDLEAATTHQDALAAACGTEADGVPRPPQGKDHELPNAPSVNPRRMLERESSRLYRLLLQGKATPEEYVAQVRREARDYVDGLRKFGGRNA